MLELNKNYNLKGRKNIIVTVIKYDSFNKYGIVMITKNNQIEFARVVKPEIINNEIQWSYGVYRNTLELALKEM